MLQWLNTLHQEVSMNIYFSCSITGGRQDEAAYQALTQRLLQLGHEVPTAHLSQPDVVQVEESVSPREVFLRDAGWVTNCDVLIAEVSTPSHGVGYEIAMAVMLDKPVLCCYQRGKKVSKMITGNSASHLSLLAYESIPQLLDGVEQYLDSHVNK
jgi:hypothetical protein